MSETYDSRHRRDSTPDSYRRDRSLNSRDFDPRNGECSHSSAVKRQGNLIFTPHLPNEHGATRMRTLIQWCWNIDAKSRSSSLHNSTGRERSRSPRRRKDDEALHHNHKRHNDRHRSHEYRRPQSPDRDSERQRAKDKEPERERKRNKSLDTVDNILHPLYIHYAYSTIQIHQSRSQSPDTRRDTHERVCLLMLRFFKVLTA
jgi:hypothetical protein